MVVFGGGAICKHAHHVINQSLLLLLSTHVEQTGQSRRGHILLHEKSHENTLEPNLENIHWNYIRKFKLNSRANRVGRYFQMLETTIQCFCSVLSIIWDF